MKEEAARIRNQRNLAMQYKVATKYAIEQQNKQRRDIVKGDETDIEMKLRLRREGI